MSHPITFCLFLFSALLLLVWEGNFLLHDVIEAGSSHGFIKKQLDTFMEKKSLKVIPWDPLLVQQGHLRQNLQVGRILWSAWLHTSPIAFLPSKVSISSHCSHPVELLLSSWAPLLSCHKHLSSWNRTNTAHLTSTTLQIGCTPKRINPHDFSSSSIYRAGKGLPGTIHLIRLTSSSRNHLWIMLLVRRRLL